MCYSIKSKRFYSTFQNLRFFPFTRTRKLNKFGVLFGVKNPYIYFGTTFEYFCHVWGKQILDMLTYIYWSVDRTVLEMELACYTHENNSCPGPILTMNVGLTPAGVALGVESIVSRELKWNLLGRTARAGNFLI